MISALFVFPGIYSLLRIKTDTCVVTAISAPLIIYGMVTAVSVAVITIRLHFRTQAFLSFLFLFVRNGCISILCNNRIRYRLPRRRSLSICAGVYFHPEDFCTRPKDQVDQNQGDHKIHCCHLQLSPYRQGSVPACFCCLPLPFSSIFFPFSCDSLFDTSFVIELAVIRCVKCFIFRQ